jgi:hypothetical protein
MVARQPEHRPLIEVLYIRDCPHYAGALALVERVRAELGIDTELGTILIGDRVAAEHARFPASRRSGSTAATSSPAVSHPPRSPSRAGCTASSTGSLANPPNAGSATPCWQLARPTPRQNRSSAPQPTSVRGEIMGDKQNAARP